MKMEKDKIKKNKGITLISLIVTIIVLIILATVSINAVIGDNRDYKKSARSQKCAI